jgi:hypothetical protein
MGSGYQALVVLVVGWCHGGLRSAHKFYEPARVYPRPSQPLLTTLKKKPLLTAAAGGRELISGSPPPRSLPTAASMCKLVIIPVTATTVALLLNPGPRGTTTPQHR